MDCTRFLVVLLDSRMNNLMDSVCDSLISYNFFEKLVSPLSQAIAFDSILWTGFSKFVLRNPCLGHQFKAGFQKAFHSSNESSSGNAGMRTRDS